METVVISQVGRQPGAVAASIAGWMSLEPATEATVLLLPTRQTAAAAERLKHYIETQYPGLSVTIEDGSTDPHLVVRSFLDRFSHPPDVVFCPDAGPGFQAARIARELLSSAAYVHSLWDQVALCRLGPNGEEWRTGDLPDLGLEQLLTMQGLDQAQWQRPPISEAMNAVLERFYIRKPKDRALHVDTGLGAIDFDLAFEARGRLYAFARLPDQYGDTVKHTIDRLHQTARGHLFNGLEVEIAVLSANQRARSMAESRGMVGIAPNDGARLLGMLSARGWQPASATAAIRGASPPQGLPARIDESQNLLLALCLQPDPAPVAQALCSFKPRAAYVFYDAASPAVCEARDRLSRVARALPVGALEFVGTDALGRGMRNYVMELMRRTREEVRFDVTPGRTAQACAAARVPSLSLWSQDRNRGAVVCLSSEDPQLAPLVGPAIPLLGYLRGGILREPGLDTEFVQGQAAFWRVLEPALLSLQTLPGGVTELPGVQRTETDQFRVAVGDRQYVTGWISNTRESAWFEQYVAWKLLSAGADEVRVGLEWQWPGKLARLRTQGADPEYWTKRSASRDQVDVIARLGHCYLVVECKRHSVYTSSALAPLARKAETQAASLIAKLSYPVVACHRAPAGMVQNRLQRGSGVAVITLDILSDTEKLREAIDQIFRSRSTFQREGLAPAPPVPTVPSPARPGVKASRPAAASPTPIRRETR